MAWEHTFTQLDDERQDGLGTAVSVFLDKDGNATFKHAGRVDTRDDADIRRYAREVLAVYAKEQTKQTKDVSAVEKITTAFTAEGA